MPLRWSRYDQYRAEQEATVSDDTDFDDTVSTPSEDSSDGDA
jgi:hypothetical protein